MNVAVYARVSTEKQEDEKTIDSQLGELDKYCSDNNHVIVQKFIDNGYTGTLLARPELDNLRDEATKGLFEAVVIHSPDRLARKYVYQEIVIEELKNKGVQVIFLNRLIAETPEDQLLLSVQGVIAEYERAKFLERTRRGRLHRAKSGHILGNIPPYGYSLIKKSQATDGFAHYVINRDEADVVRLIFKLLSEKKYTTYKIMLELRKLGIKARNGKEWGRSSIHKVERNITYTGTTFYNKHYGVPSQNGEKYHKRKNSTFKLRPKTDWIPISVPQIIDEETFLQSQKQLENNWVFSNRNAKQSYLLRGLIKCGIDGRSYVGVPMHGKAFYRCSGKNRLLSPTPCESKSISSQKIEPIVWNTLTELLNNPSIIKDQIGKWNKKQKEQVDVKSVNLEEVNKKLLLLEDEEKRLITAFSKGVIELDQLKDQNERIKQQKDYYSTQKENLLKHSSKTIKKQQITVTKFIKRYRETMESLETGKKQEILRLLLKEILVKDRKVIIKGVLPLGTNVKLRPQPVDERPTGRWQNFNGQDICHNLAKVNFRRKPGSNQNLFCC